MTARLFVVNGLITVRLVPELAMEIGLHESLVLLQVDYLLATRGEIKGNDSIPWIRCSVRDMQAKFFPFWSVATIDRTIADLAERNLLLIGNFNPDPKDTTRWLTYGPECSKLQAARMVMAEGLVEPTKAKRPAKPAAPPEHSVYEIAQTLATVCNIEFEMNKGRLLKEATAFKDHTREEILQLYYGPHSPWFMYDFRGKQGSFPSLSQVRTEWGKMARYAQVMVQQKTAVKAPDGGLNI